MAIIICLVGASHCKSYSPHTVIPNFSHNELNAIVLLTTT